MKRAILIVWLAAVGGARGDIINDWGGNSFEISGGEGQAFTAVDPQIHVASIAITHFSPSFYPFGTSITASIYDGTGMGGTLLATSTLANIPSGRRGWVNFEFGDIVELVVGGRYTLWVTEAGGTPWRVDTDPSNHYGDGFIIGAQGYDMRFRILTAPLPGACCINDGCLDDVGQDSCEAANGLYHGDGRACDDNFGLCSERPCCTDVGCFHLTETECVARDDWQDWPRTSCNYCVPPLGACCFTGLCLPDRTEAECLSVSAAWAGPLTGCDSCPPCEGPDFDGDGAEDNCDTDIDNDGVRNELDVCDFTPLGLDVQANGTVPADLDGDCNVDLRDYALWQVSLTGP